MLGEQVKGMFSDQIGSKQYVHIFPYLSAVPSRTLVAGKATKSAIPKGHWMHLAIQISAAPCRTMPCHRSGLQFPKMSRISHASHTLFGQPQCSYGAPGGLPLITAARLQGPSGTSATKRSFRIMSHHFAICKSAFRDLIQRRLGRLGKLPKLSFLCSTL